MSDRHAQAFWCLRPVARGSSAGTSSVCGCTSETTRLSRTFPQKLSRGPVPGFPHRGWRLQRAFNTPAAGSGCHVRVLGWSPFVCGGVWPAAGGGCVARIEGGWKLASWWGLRPGGVGGGVVVLADLGGCLRRGELVHDVVRPGASTRKTICFVTCLPVDVLQRRSGPPPSLPPARSQDVTSSVLPRAFASQKLRTHEHLSVHQHAIKQSSIRGRSQT